MGKPSFAGNSGLRGMARALVAGTGKKLGLYERASAPGKPVGVPVGSEAPKGKGRKSV